MKATKKATVVLDLVMVQVDRIWTEFRYQEIGAIFEAAREAALRKDKSQAPDPALIPVRVEVTLAQARTILARFKEFAGFPSYREVYDLVKKAIDSAEKAE